MKVRYYSGEIEDTNEGVELLESVENVPGTLGGFNLDLGDDEVHTLYLGDGKKTITIAMSQDERIQLIAELADPRKV